MVANFDNFKNKNFSLPQQNYLFLKKLTTYNKKKDIKQTTTCPTTPRGWCIKLTPKRKETKFSETGPSKV